VDGRVESGCDLERWQVVEGVGEGVYVDVVVGVFLVGGSPRKASRKCCPVTSVTVWTWQARLSTGKSTV
jgi:hypothetical protein